MEIPKNRGNNRTIKLSQGKVALFDLEDYELISPFKWSCSKRGRTWYAERTDWNGGNQKKIYMHRLIAKAQYGEEVDHIDGNGLNNCRSNLRIVSRQDNCRNTDRSRPESSSKYRGVTKRGDKWLAQATEMYVNYRLGLYDTEIEAARAYDLFVICLRGNYAKVNFSLPTEWVCQSLSEMISKGSWQYPKLVESITPKEIKNKSRD